MSGILFILLYTLENNQINVCEGIKYKKYHKMKTVKYVSYTNRVNPRGISIIPEVNLN